MNARALALTGAAVLAIIAAPLAGPVLLPPCQLEDSPGPCFWDAQTRGNGEGTSFVNLNGGAR